MLMIGNNAKHCMSHITNCLYVNGFQLRINKIYKLKWSKTLKVAPVSIIYRYAVYSYILMYNANNIEHW